MEVNKNQCYQPNMEACYIQNIKFYKIETRIEHIDDCINFRINFQPSFSKPLAAGIGEPVSTQLASA